MSDGTDQPKFRMDYKAFSGDEASEEGLLTREQLDQILNYRPCVADWLVSRGATYMDDDGVDTYMVIEFYDTTHQTVTVVSLPPISVSALKKLVDQHHAKHGLSEDQIEMRGDDE